MTRGRVDGGGSGRRRARVVLLGLGLCLAAAATGGIVVTEDPKLLRLAVVAALWAFVLAAMSTAPRRLPDEQQRELTAGREAELRRTYELELEREVAARREYEMQLEVYLRRELESGLREQVDALRNEVDRLRGDVIERLDGELRMERIETTRLIGGSLRALRDEARRLGIEVGDDSLLQLDDPAYAGDPPQRAELPAGADPSARAEPARGEPAWSGAAPGGYSAQPPDAGQRAEQPNGYPRPPDPRPDAPAYPLLPPPGQLPGTVAARAGGQPAYPGAGEPAGNGYAPGNGIPAGQNGPVGPGYPAMPADPVGAGLTAAGQPGYGPPTYAGPGEPNGYPAPGGQPGYPGGRPRDADEPGGYPQAGPVQDWPRGIPAEAGPPGWSARPPEQGGYDQPYPEPEPGYPTGPDWSGPPPVPAYGPRPYVTGELPVAPAYSPPAPPPASEDELNRILTGPGQPPIPRSGHDDDSRRRRRYREDDEPNEVMSRLLGRGDSD